MKQSQIIKISMKGFKTESYVSVYLIKHIHKYNKYAQRVKMYIRTLHIFKAVRLKRVYLKNLFGKYS